MEQIIHKLAVLQYLAMEDKQDFGEAGRERVRIDFARHILKLPAAYQISTTDLEKFDSFISEQRKIFRNTDIATEIKSLMRTARNDKNVLIAARKDGFPIIIFGKIVIHQKAEYKIYVIEEELARTPTAVLSLAAFTQPENKIIIRRAAIEHGFYRKWATNNSFAPKNLFIEESIEAITVHEICHQVVLDSFKDSQDIYFHGKMIDAYLPHTLVDDLNEILAEWEPDYGVIPYFAKIARTDYAKARRMLLRYIADARFTSNSDQSFYANYSAMLFSSLKAYIKSDSVINFNKILQDAPVIYNNFRQQFVGILEKLLNLTEDALFDFKGVTIDYQTLAEAQHKTFQGQDPKYSPDSPLHKRYYWANMVNYLKNCSKQTFNEISSLVN